MLSSPTTWHRLKKNQFGYSVALMIGLGAVACKTEQKVASNPPKPGPAPTLFTLAGKPVLVDEFKYIYEKNNAADSLAYTERNLRDYLDLFVNFKLKVAEAQALGLDTTREFVNEFNDYKKQLARPFLTENSLSEKMVKEAYDRLQEEVRAAHILLPIPQSPEGEPDTAQAYQQITDLRRRALAGEDFGKLAEEYSQDPGSKVQGGDLGFFTALQMVYPFESAAYNTKAGGVSEVVRTQFGYHLLKVSQRRPAKGSVRIAHIWKRFGQTEQPSAQDSAAAYQQILEIEKQLKGGADWASLAEKYSDDPNSRGNGGEMGWFSTGNLRPELSEVAFSLAQPGDVSAPAKSPFGWHLIRLLEKKPLPPFAELEPMLKQRVVKDSRAEVNRAALLQKLRRDNQFVENLENKALIYNKVDTTLLKGMWSFNRADADLDKPVFSLNGQNYRLRQVLNFIENNQASLMNNVLKPYTTSLYEQFVDQTVLDYEERNLPDRYPEYRFLTNEYREGILLFKVMEEKVWTKALADKAGLEKFFNTNQAKYQWADRVEAQIYTLDNEKTLTSLKEALQKDWHENPAINFPETRFTLNNAARPDSSQLPNLDRLANYLQNDSLTLVDLRGFQLPGEKAKLAEERIASVKAYLLAKGVAAQKIAEKSLGQITLPDEERKSYKGGGVRYAIFSRAKTVMVQQLNQTNPLAVQLNDGLFQASDNPLLAKITWKLGAYDLAENGKLYHVVVQAVEPARPKRLDETRGIVISDYQNYLEQQWLQELKAKYPVTINEATIKGLLANKK
ncbi:MAG: peptidylprolyl isomerase [Bernardetiaceae bacterium]|nr:peptidylprolyl isomerase [Bernardetiaceae bacterium]